MASGSNLFQNQTYFILCSFKNSLVERSHHIRFILAKELIEFRKKTAEFEAADNGSNAYYKNDTGA